MACVFRVLRPIFDINVKNIPVRTIHSRGICMKRYVKSISTFSMWKVNEKSIKRPISCEPVVTKGASIRTFCTDKKLTLEDINEKVLKVCNAYDKIPENQASLDSHFMNDLGLDSLDHVELIMNMEDEFNLEIPDSDAEKMLRPRDIVNYLVMKLQHEGCVQ